MTFGELRALPVGRGQIGKVKYLEVGRAGGRGPSIPASVIKTGVKLPQLQSGSLLLQEEDKPSLIQMRQELDQITTNISENPFMKNDMKKKDNSMTETTETDKTENIPNKSAVDQEEPSVVHSVQTDDLKKELSQVLQEMRKNEEESRLCKDLPEESESSTPLEDDSSDMTLPSTAAASDISQEDDLEREVEDDIEKTQEDFESPEAEGRQSVSEGQVEEDNKITENEEEEISAL